MAAETLSDVWTKVRTDDWHWTWTTTSNVSTWSDPRITIRESRSSTATVLATTEAVAPTITTTGTNFSTGTLAWQIAYTVSTTFAPGLYWLEVEVLIGTDRTTILSHSLRVRDEVAVAL
jgi:hypothetical protein